MAKPPKRSTKIETDMRVYQVYKLLLNGYHRSDIIRFVMERTDWGVGEASVERYISLANREFEKYGIEPSIKRERGKALARYNLIYRKQMDEEDYKGARDTQARIDKISGLEVVKLEHTGKDGERLVIKVVTVDGNGTSQD